VIPQPRALTVGFGLWEQSALGFGSWLGLWALGFWQAQSLKPET
jgi:hypothetical protein